MRLFIFESAGTVVLPESFQLDSAQSFSTLFCDHGNVVKTACCLLSFICLCHNLLVLLSKNELEC